MDRVEIGLDRRIDTAGQFGGTHIIVAGDLVDDPTDLFGSGFRQ